MSAAWKSWPAPADGIGMHAWQNDRCAVCSRSNGTRRLVLDHCHLTGLVRGYLCSSCNSQEGWGSDAAWGDWRSGDNPANAHGWYEIYRNHLGATPISPYGALNYYSHHERAAWFELLPTALAEGRTTWPEDAPWIDTALARKAEAEEQVRTAVDSIFGGRFSSPKSGGAA